MHRSGTSAVAGVLQRLGFRAGSNLIEPAFDNSKGFYEDADVVDLNEQMLSSLGLDWTFRGVVGENDLEQSEMTDFKLKATRILKRYQKLGQKCFIKDPRLSFTLPLWKACAIDLGFSPKCLLVLRDRYAIAQSLMRRNGIGELESLDLIRGYYLSATQNSITTDTKFVNYSDLISDSRSFLAELESFFSLNNMTPDIISRVDEFISQTISPLANRNTDLPLNDIIDYNSSDLNIDHGLIRDAIRECKKKYEFNNRSCISLPHLVKFLINKGGTYAEVKDIGNVILSSGQKEFSISHKCSLYDVDSIRIVFPIIIKSIDLIKVGLANDGVLIDYNLTTTGRVSDTRIEFDDGVPLLDLNLKINGKIDSIDLLCKFNDTANVSSSNPQSKRDYGFASAFMAALRHPISLMRNLNGKNFRTLKRAIGRERPQYIIRNFIKLLSDKKDLESLSSKNGASNVARTSEKLLVNLQSNIESKNVARKKVAYVMDRIPRYDTASGDKRVTNILKLLSTVSDLSLYVSYLPVDDIYREELEQFASIRQIGKTPFDSEVIIYNTYKAFVDYKRVLEVPESIFQIIDTVDVHWVREARALGHWEAIDENIVKRNETAELNSYKEVDLVWAVSEHDRKLLKNSLPNIECKIVSNIHESSIACGPNLDSKLLLFIGDFAHHPNRSTLRLIVDDILPQILVQVPEARLLVVGANADSEIIKLCGDKGVDFRGYVSIRELEEIYSSVLLSLAPMISGSGVKGKITEAILKFIPVATNSIGNEGIGLEDGVTGIVEDDVLNYSSKIVALLKDSSDLVRMTELAQQQFENMFSSKTALQSILDSIYKQITICIPTHNKLEYLRPCVESIVANTYYPNYKILVYSNACTDGTAEYLENLQEELGTQIDFIHSNENKVFVIPCNEMIVRAESSDIVLLNNDTVVNNGWLSALVELAYSSNSIGVVGSKVLNSDGSLQEFGSIVYKNGEGLNIGKGDDASAVEYQESKRASYVSGCSMYIKRSTIETIGLLDDEFSPAYFEDSDYCYRVWDKGLEVWVSSESVVVHKEGGTSGRDTSVGIKKFQEVNKLKFLTKHSNKIEMINSSVTRSNNLSKSIA